MLIDSFTDWALDVGMPARSSHRRRGNGEAARPRRRGAVEAIEIYRGPDNRPSTPGR